MVVGIGTDILKIQRISEIIESSGSTFVPKVYSQNEIEQARLRDNPLLYFATRFSGKEAVVKCFGNQVEKTSLNEIEILNTEKGKPEVTLRGKTLSTATGMGIGVILVSLSFDSDYVQAFAIALSPPDSGETNAILHI